MAKLFYEHYIKLAHIGKGANAHVYKVRHAELGYVRAIKILNDYIESKSERAYQSFLKECKTLLAIGNGSHPNIVRIYGPDLIENHAIVEMDYVQGTTLDSYIKKKGFLEYDEVKTFIHDIVGALAYTHHDIYRFLMNPEEDKLEDDPNDGSKYLISQEKEAELVKKYGIAHNDLHSNNVMRRDYDGSFVLLDFGLAVQDGECIKSSRKSDGSPEYKAPEKFDSGEITPRSDIYSLGVLIFESLTGRPPFVLDINEDEKVSYPSLSKICDEHHNQTPPPIFPLRKAAFERQIPGAVYERDYPEWLENVVMKCLAKKPEDRYADAKELLDDINWHITHEVQKATLNSPSSDSNGQGSNTANPSDTDNDSDVDDDPELLGHKSKANKKNLLFIIGGCIVLVAAILYYILSFGKDQRDCIPATGIDIPATEYSLNVGDSVVIIPKVIPTDASDTIVTLISSNPEIALVKGNTIVALKSGDVILTASTKDTKITKDVLVKVSNINNSIEKSESTLEKDTSVKSIENNSQVSDRRLKGSTNNSVQPVVDDIITSPREEKVSTSRQNTNAINLGYGTWYGAVKNGKPHGKGKLVFSSQHKVDRKTEIMANPGDYFDAVYENGQLISGSLFDNSGNKKNTIIP